MPRPKTAAVHSEEEKKAIVCSSFNDFSGVRYWTVEKPLTFGIRKSLVGSNFNFIAFDEALSNNFFAYAIFKGSILEGRIYS